MYVFTLLAFTALAAGSADGSSDLLRVNETIQVTAPAPVIAGEQITPAGGIVTVIGSDQVSALGANDLAAALRMVPGVSISRYNPVGSYGGGEGGAVFIRGQGTGRPGSEIRLYVDGAPLEVGVWAHPLLDLAPLDHAGEIRIIRGPQPWSYGGTFGAVELTSRFRAAAGFETALDVSGGSHGSMFETAHHGGQIGRFNYYVGQSHQQSDGHRPHADGERDSYYLRLGLALPADISLAYSGHLSDNWARDPGREDTAVPDRDKFATDAWTHSINLNHQSGPLTGEVILYAVDGAIRWAKDHLSGPTTPAGSSNTDFSSYGARLREEFRAGMVTLGAGIEVDSSGGRSWNVTDTGHIPFDYSDRFVTVAPAVSGMAEVPLGARWTLRPSLSVRYYDHNELSSSWSPSAGLVLESETWTGFVSAARGVHYPGVWTTGVSAGTWRDLDPELLDHVEAGIALRVGRAVHIRASVFRDGGQDILQWTPDGILNVGDYTGDGLELNVIASPVKPVSLFLGTTYVSADPPKFPRLPKWSVSGGCTWTFFGRAQLNVDGQYVDSQYAANIRTGQAGWDLFEQIGAFTVLNAKLSAALPAMSRFAPVAYIAVENLLNEEYVFQPGYPMPGTSAVGGITLSF